MKETVHRFWYNLVKNQLRFRVWIILLLVVLTGAFSWKIYTGLKVETNFFELYPPKHAYIKLYKEFRKMFGSANVLSIILERTDGKDIYNPETLKKLDELTRGILTVKGVNPLQVSSVSHPKIKQITTNAFGVGVFPLMYPAVGHPKTQQGADTFRKTVYGNAGVRGFYIALDDKSAAVYAGFWEEGLDFGYMFKAVRQLQDSVEDANHKCHISGYPMLYAWLDHYKTEVMAVLVVTLVSMTLLLAAYFRSLRGVLIPVISGALSGLWGLGFASMMGFNVDPLLLVVPVLLSARALSHSCQCMERYHQEYSIIGDNQKAIVSAYGALYPPALLAIVTDGLGVLTIAIATIPLMQKLAYVSSFWIISIFIGVAVVNPIILSYMKPPALDENIQVRNWLGKRKFSWWSRCYQSFVRLLHRLSGPRSKWVMGLIIVALVFGGGLFCADNLKIGDSSAGGAILYPDHPYNIAAEKMNKGFVGASRLVVVVKGREKGAIKDQKTLQTMEKLSFYMQNNIESVGGTLSLIDLVRRINRTYHDGSPKWEMVPEKDRDLGAIYFLLASNMAPGEMDQFVSLPDYTHSNVTGFFRDYDHKSIKNAIASIKTFAEGINNDPSSRVEIKLAGGILGILAAVNEEVEWSYWAILAVIFATTFLLCLITYRSVKAALILIMPLYASQVVCELFMMAMHIDLNIDSLPVAAIGVGVGIDYGIYLMSRLKEECGKTNDFERAKLMALTTTGKIIMFTALTLVVGVVFWLFSTLKFQAEMGLLILILMIFNMFGALVFIPSLTAILKPNFVKDMVMDNACRIDATELHQLASEATH